MAGDADETRDFLFFQFLYCRKHAIRIADALKILKTAQAVDLNQVDVVGLQEPKTRFYRTKCAVTVSGIDLGGEEDFFAARLGKLAQPFLAQALDGAGRWFDTARNGS